MNLSLCRLYDSRFVYVPLRSLNFRFTNHISAERLLVLFALLSLAAYVFPLSLLYFMMHIQPECCQSVFLGMPEYLLSWSRLLRRLSVVSSIVLSQTVYQRLLTCIAVLSGKATGAHTEVVIISVITRCSILTR